ncbi:TPA: ROK family protein [Streptococcus suis]
MSDFLAIDIGGTYIKHGKISKDGTILEQSKGPTPQNIVDFKLFLRNIIEQFGSTISGICISCPGNVNNQTGFVRSGGLIPYLKNIPLAEEMSAFSGLPVTVLNDADAAGLAEAKSGSLKDCYCGGTLVLGTGVGLSIVSNGQLIGFTELQSKGLLTRPIRHSIAIKDRDIFHDLGMTLDLHWQGIQSLIHNQGSAVDFVNQASEHLGLAESDGLKVFEAIQNREDQRLQELFDNYCNAIATLILNLRLLVHVEKVALGGGVSQQNILISGIKESYKNLVSALQMPVTPNIESVRIQAAHYHNDANLLGALYFHLQKTA